jgi:hypothetical protein
MEDSPRVHDIKGVVIEREVLRVCHPHVRFEAIEAESLSREGYRSLRQVDPSQRARARLCPLQVVGPHTNADLENIAAGSLTEPGKLEDERLQLVTGCGLPLETLTHFLSAGVDLAAGGFIPKGSDALFLLVAISRHRQSHFTRRDAAIEDARVGGNAKTPMSAVAFSLGS